MKKDDLKKLMFSGFMVGCLSISQTGVADETEKTLDEVTELVATEDKTIEEVLAAGCRGGGSCATKTSPQNRNITEEEQDYNQSQGQGQNHSCAGQRPQPYQGRVA